LLPTLLSDEGGLAVGVQWVNYSFPADCALTADAVPTVKTTPIPEELFYHSTSSALTDINSKKAATDLQILLGTNTELL
jgi:hypothetical protein